MASETEPGIKGLEAAASSSGAAGQSTSAWLPSALKRNNSSQQEGFVAEPEITEETIQPKKSVSFSRLSGQASKAMAVDDADSSADEQTGILNNQRDGAADYSAVGNSSSVLRAGDDGVSLRKRKTSPRPESPPEPEPENSWLQKLKHKYGSVELDNHGSVARDHLALGSHFHLELYFPH